MCIYSMIYFIQGAKVVMHFGQNICLLFVFYA